MITIIGILIGIFNLAMMLLAFVMGYTIHVKRISVDTKITLVLMIMSIATGCGNFLLFKFV
jgi:hypothetical protein